MTCTATAITESSVGTVTCSEYTGYTCPTYTEWTGATNPFVGTGTTGTASDTTPPVMSGFTAITISDTWASFKWETDEPATCRVDIGKSFPFTSAVSFVHAHYVMGERNVVATGLIKDTTYYVIGYSTDIYGNGTQAGVHTFKTAGTGGIGGEPIQDYP